MSRELYLWACSDAPSQEIHLSIKMTQEPTETLQTQLTSNFFLTLTEKKILQATEQQLDETQESNMNKKRFLSAPQCILVPNTLSTYVVFIFSTRVVQRRFERQLLLVIK